jgi:hypothetical protein
MAVKNYLYTVLSIFVYSFLILNSNFSLLLSGSTLKASISQNQGSTISVSRPAHHPLPRPQDFPFPTQPQQQQQQQLPVQQRQQQQQPQQQPQQQQQPKDAFADFANFDAVAFDSLPAGKSAGGGEERERAKAMAGYVACGEVFGTRYRTPYISA